MKIDSPIINVVTFIIKSLVLGMIWAIPTMLLWDLLMPEIFGVGKITLVQAWGLNILTDILFKSKTPSVDIKFKDDLNCKTPKVNKKINLYD